MQDERVKVLTIALLILFIVLGLLSTRYSTPPIFEVPSLGIRLPVKFAQSQEEAQRYADDPSCGAYYCIKNRKVIVADHRHQSFYDLPFIRVGADASFGEKHYICQGISVGYSINGIRMKDGSELPEADLYAVTCTGYADYEVFIISFKAVMNK